MSYILDALAKADAERRNGSEAPVAHALPRLAQVRTARRWRWLLPTAALILAAAVAFVWQQHASLDTPATPSDTTVPQASAPAAVDRAASPATPADSTTPMPAPSTGEAPEAHAAPLPILAPKPPPVARPASDAATPPPKLAPSAPPVATLAASPTPEYSANAGASVAPPAALPRPPVGAPALTISGATYSDNPAHRMLIVNGKVVQEGQEAAPGVRLEAIGPRSAIFNQGGTRFNINHQ